MDGARAPDGEVTVIELAESAVTVPAVVPNLTDVAPDRLDPVTVTVLPPAVGPDVGLTPLTVGPATTFRVKSWVAGDSIPLVAVRHDREAARHGRGPAMAPPVNVRRWAGCPTR